MKSLILLFGLCLFNNLQAQTEEELPGLLRSELQELVENSKVVSVNLEDSNKIEEMVVTQSAAPVREQAQVSEGQELTSETQTNQRSQRQRSR